MLWVYDKDIDTEISIAISHFKEKYPYKIVTILVHKSLEEKDLTGVNFLMKGQLGIAYE